MKPIVKVNFEVTTFMAGINLGNTACDCGNWKDTLSNKFDLGPKGSDLWRPVVPAKSPLAAMTLKPKTSDGFSGSIQIADLVGQLGWNEAQAGSLPHITQVLHDFSVSNIPNLGEDQACFFPVRTCTSLVYVLHITASTEAAKRLLRLYRKEETVFIRNAEDLFFVPDKQAA